MSVTGRGPSWPPTLSAQLVSSYSIFGATLRSTLALPGLPSAESGDARWTLRVSDEPAPAADAVVPDGTRLGHDGRGGCTMALWRTPQGFRYTHSCTGAYDVHEAGRTLVWHPAPHLVGAPARPDVLDLVRNDVANRVLAVALLAAGTVALHASGVATADGGAIGFLAAKGTGKSTLAAALVRAGGRLVTDDTFAVAEQDEALLVLPGVHHLRLHDDAAAHALPEALGDDASAATGADGKQVHVGLEAAILQTAAAPLRALYLLEPAPAHATAPVTRTPLTAVPAAMALVAHAKLAPILGGSALPVLLDGAAAICERTPVYRLAVARDLRRLDEVAARILAWHGHPAPALVG